MAEWRAPLPLGLPKPAVHQLAEEVARTVHYACGEDLAPIVSNLYGELKTQDFWQLSASNDGSIEIDPNGQFSIFLPDYVTELRNRFTIAHELGHYFLHYLYQNGREEKWAFRAKRYTDTKTDRTEWEANWFAAAFLMPSEEFKAAWTDLRGNLELLSRKFQVSTTAIELHGRYHKCPIYPTS